MYVRMTVPQLELARRHSEGWLLECFHREVTVHSATMVDVVAPFTAFEIVKDRLVTEHLTRSAGRTVKAPKTVLPFLRRVSKAQNVFTRHPALRKAGMIGRVTGWFPVWDVDGVYHPTPFEGGTFVVLGPVWTKPPRAAIVTTWSPAGLYPKGHWLADPETHTRLLDHHR